MAAPQTTAAQNAAARPLGVSPARVISGARGLPVVIVSPRINPSLSSGRGPGMCFAAA
ncbi:MAG: hypothetical protein Tsb0010_09510 [Parvularculaceae bacterium]